MNHENKPLEQVEQGPKTEKIPPEEQLDYLEKMGRDITNTFIESKAMLKNARDNNKELFIDDMMKDFVSKFEILRGEVLKIKTGIANSGVKMTAEDMNRTLEETGTKRV